MSEPTLADLGERGLIARLGRFFGRGKNLVVAAGDDGAVLALGDRLLVATSDLLFDGIHFSDQTTSAFDVGWRAAAANLSDLAAMGAEPIGTLIGLGLTEATPVSWVEQLYAGFTACADPVGGIILGGDTCRAKSRSVAVTALGAAPSGRILRRDAARPGDLLVVTGHLGASCAGLAVLQQPERYSHLDPAVRERVIEAHRRPVARLGVAPLVFSACDRAAAMDTSDGLTDAIEQVCGQSGCGAIVDLENVPIDPATRAVAGGDAERWALGGGEDYELLIALEAAAAGDLIRMLGNSGLAATVVGEVTAERPIVDRRGQPLAGPQFEHFGDIK
ncbi:thiamine-phosphate kinase [Gloeobacter kilaueensis]|uniref:Thiamine-monophosphate kinase n=1 Tax=Gloeobacter kilaueensis (strain ATCC BAA-2537 / CCAP 1431/1 / ULC 316 / JS1) TaxID=1183438 RepID=U5QGL3_GLOK1|nr:thiamine-phosphate kinase [Gloeobacter kilaueensis]AGY58107.1 thiamine-monophosphate kinase [Gloeobacter kilaueensis JS1]